MPKWRKESILDIYSLLLAIKIDVWASSAAVAAVSIATLVAFSVWEEWLNLLLGAWLILSPWVIGFAHTRAMHYSIGIGATVAFFTAIELLLVYDASTQDPVSRGSVSTQACCRAPAVCSECLPS